MDENCSQVIAKGSGRFHRIVNDNKEQNWCAAAAELVSDLGTNVPTEAPARAADLPEGFQFFTILIRD